MEVTEIEDCEDLSKFFFYLKKSRGFCFWFLYCLFSPSLIQFLYFFLIKFNFSAKPSEGTNYFSELTIKQETAPNLDNYPESLEEFLTRSEPQMFLLQVRFMDFFFFLY